ncbi:YeaC family protein [Salinicola rhizosphaerae]|uniref:DUF1315 family protein n=1 Tax=Salinicola rhizosphaerae TaxID=1443141 RepID=A0ABQ3EER9_9GAMM|nr:DUF1315 family protein [Salinicola rhizosphaerae]GHB30123.1 hypothetical protein GCM10009038_31110 [Salinicola rhizosphaerae]
MSETSFDDMVAQMTPELYERFKQAIQLRKWPDGRRLTGEQTELCLEAVIKYERFHDLPPEQRIGYLERNECSSGTHSSSGTRSSAEEAAVKWIN